MTLATANIATMFRGAEAGDPPAQPWSVLHVRPRAEKVVAEALASHDVEHYLPLLSVRHTYAKSAPVFTKPLFPGYVFLRGGADARERALRTHRVVSVLPVLNQAQLDAELQQVRRALECGAPVELFPAIQAGVRCRVASGPLMGVEGVVVERGPRTRVFLSVTTLGQSAVLEIDIGLLEIA